NSAWDDELAPDSGAGKGGLHLPGEADGAAEGSGVYRSSPEARRRNQWRQFKQLTPDFGVAPAEPQPVVRPSARNAALPSFNQGVAPPPLTKPNRAGRPRSPASTHTNGAPLQRHPHSIPPSPLAPGGSVSPGQGSTPSGTLSPNVTPLRSPRRRWSPDSRRPAYPAAAGRMSDRPLAPTNPELSMPPGASPPLRRSRAATARRRLANPPLPLLYLIRLVILGVGVAAIAGTLLSVLSPSNVASPGDEPIAPARAASAGASGSLVQGRQATTVTDLRLTSEIPRLGDELEQLATLTPGLTPVAFAIDLDSGQYVDLGGIEPVAAASTIKVPILVAFLRQVDAGTMTLSQSFRLQEEYMAGGSGTLRSEAVGTEYTALDIATRMIVTSDNTATNMMIAALGGIETLNQTFADWGLEQTLLRNPLPDLDGTNTTSARDMALIMALVDQGGLLTPRSRDRMFSIMQRTENISLIPSGIDDKSLTAHKTGDIGGLLGDVALVDVPNGKRYALALLVQRPTNDGRASELIRRMTETIHAEMAQPVAPLGNPNAAPAGADDTEPYTIENPDAVEPMDMEPLDRAPARDEIPPG
ncbi:MAG: serine hydrolase, partial [Nodosilinea sp.]